jgi:hypothetical protein
LEKAWPIIGRTPSTSNRAGDTRAPATRSESVPPAVASAYGQNRKAAMVSNCLDSRSMSEKKPLESGRSTFLPSAFVFEIQIIAMRDGSL